MNIKLTAQVGSELLNIGVETIVRQKVLRVVLETPTGAYEMWLDKENGRLNVMAVAPNTLVVLPQVTNVIQLQGDKLL